MAVSNEELEQVLRAQNEMLLGLYRHALGNGWMKLDEYVPHLRSTMDAHRTHGFVNDLTQPWYDLADQHQRASS